MLNDVNITVAMKIIGTKYGNALNRFSLKFICNFKFNLFFDFCYNAVSTVGSHNGDGLAATLDWYKNYFGHA